MTAIAKGAFVAIVAASSRVNASIRSGATKWFTIRHSLALRASKGAAVKNTSLMRLTGSRPRKCSSPVMLYGNPRFAGVMANDAVGHLGRDSVAPMPAVKGDDADLSD